MTVIEQPPPRVWIDDRHLIFRQGLVSCLRADGLEVAGESADLEPQPDPDLVDVMIFGVEVETVGRFIEWAAAGHRLVALVPSSRSEELVFQVMEAGVTAVLFRAELHPDRLAGTVRAAHAGSSTFPTGSLPAVLHRASLGGASSARGLAEREISVLRLLAQGEDTKQVGDTLGYSERTVKNIVHDSLMKLDCRNRVHAVAEAIRRGLI